MKRRESRREFLVRTARTAAIASAFGFGPQLGLPGRASGAPGRACAPVAGRLFFANQDNWANPSIETSITTAHQAAEAIRAKR